MRRWLILLLFMPLLVLMLEWLGISDGHSFRLRMAADGTRIELTTDAIADDAVLEVRGVNDGQETPPLLGTAERTKDGLVFKPLLPLLTGQEYRLTWKKNSGKMGLLTRRFETRHHTAPTVSMTPQAVFPANALKFYLHFSQPMEQGVFLDCLQLYDRHGREVTGPFRETELWSPDGRRLTVWFHPGRQKTGVNLNEEEGPVLREGTRYELLLTRDWRSTAGVLLGAAVTLPFYTGKADHDCPQPALWKIAAPRALTHAPLSVVFDEPLDTAMLASALRVQHDGAQIALKVTVSPTGKDWSAVPARPWAAGGYELHADPLLEDLAGNNLSQPFEVDLTAPAVSEVADVGGGSVNRLKPGLQNRIQFRVTAD